MREIKKSITELKLEGVYILICSRDKITAYFKFRETELKLSTCEFSSY